MTARSNRIPDLLQEILSSAKTSQLLR